jgi:hypothetical protein
MFQRITFADFIDAFRAHGREAQFSYAAKKAMFEYLEELEEETGEQIELDVIGLCCDFQESSVDDIISDYGLDASGCESDDDRRRLVGEFLNDRTDVIWWDGDTFLFRAF